MNKFRILILFLVVIATVEIFFIFIPTDAFADQEPTNFPNSIKIQKESTIFGVNISVTNADNVPHTFTAGTITEGPSGEFDSKFLEPNGEYTFVIEYMGEIPYFCMIHPWEEGILKISNDDLYLLNQEMERERLEKEQERLELEKETEQERLELEKQEAKKQKFNEIDFDFHNFMDYTLVIDQNKYSIPDLEEMRLYFGEEKYQLFEEMAKREINVAITIEEKAFEIEIIEWQYNLFKQDMSERFVLVDEFFEDTKQQINNLDISEDEKIQYINEIQNEKDATVSEIMRGMKVLVQLEDDIVQMKKDLEFEADLLGQTLEFDDPICGEGTIMKNGQCVVDTRLVIDSEPTANGGGCLIATATYGTELAPQVQLLRELRDNSLLQTEAGSIFMKSFNDVYYSFSPIIADYERENPVFKQVVKIAITPMITSLSLMEYADSESEVLGYGINLIVLNLAMYIGIPASVIVGIRKKF